MKERHRDAIVNQILSCKDEDQEKHLECARLKFSESFAPFEADWALIENKTNAPAPSDEIEVLF